MPKAMTPDERILLVDDDANLLAGFERTFQRRYWVLTACGAAAGLEALQTHGPFAVVMSDMRMPDMDGVQFLSLVRAQAPDTVRIMLTGHPDIETALAAVNRGNIFRFLTKPCVTAEIEAAITAGLDQYRLVKSRSELLEMQLRHAQKMELVGQCAAGVAHDLNNVLSIIQVCAWEAARPQVSAASLTRSLDQIQHALANATSLTRQLLGFSRRQNQVVFAPVNLSTLIEESMPLLRHLLPRNVTIHWQPAGPLELVAGDASLLRQVIMNLVLNARDAMPQGGRVQISAEIRIVTAQHLNQSPDVRLGRFVCLSLTDEGCGMDTTIRSRIFEPFFTTKPEDQGTGLGLAVVASIVKQHQGWIEVASRMGQGASFDVYLPSIARPAAPGAEPTQS